jgi:DNA topoisomerase-3
MSQTDEGKWRVEFNELWAKEGAKAPEGQEEASGDAATTATTAPAREEEKRSAA